MLSTIILVSWTGLSLIALILLVSSLIVFIFASAFVSSLPLIVSLAIASSSLATVSSIGSFVGKFILSISSGLLTAGLGSRHVANKTRNKLN